MSTPPPPIGTLHSTPEDPWRSLEISGQTVRYAGVVANLTGNSAISMPLCWNDGGLPIGVHFLGRFGDEATLIRLAAQLETAQPWADRLQRNRDARARQRPNSIGGPATAVAACRLPHKHRATVRLRCGHGHGS
jgi:Asp-tRNA(Asn)/Glu-tRNA(Gln) amidotransferase A subunit family amidase